MRLIITIRLIKPPFRNIFDNFLRMRVLLEIGHCKSHWEPSSITDTLCLSLTEIMSRLVEQWID